MTRLNEGNNIPAITNLVSNIPKPSGGRDLHKALDTIKDQVFTPAAGDRPNAPNICIFFAPGGRGLGYKLRRKLRKTCYRIIVLRRAVEEDLDKIRERVCPEAEYFDGL